MKYNSIDFCLYLQHKHFYFIILKDFCQEKKKLQDCGFAQYPIASYISESASESIGSPLSTNKKEASSKR